MSKIPRKNCNECTLRHRTCVFESPSHHQCTRCIKNNLICFFKKSGEYYLMSLQHYLLHSTQPLLLTFFCPEQGRRNDFCLNMKTLSLKMIDLYFQLLPVQQISKVIVFTAAPCHAWLPGPDATLLII